MTDLVLLKNNEPLTTSFIIARELKRTHKSIANIIKQYRIDFEELGKIGEFQMSQRNGNNAIYYYLNEQHLTFLIMMLRVKQNENDKVLEFKKKITKEFFRMKNLLLNLSTQKANQEWLEVRKKGKVSRLKETDILKEFKEYAINQGSKGYNRKGQVYVTFSNMENSTLFLIDKLMIKELKKKKQSLRDLLNINQLDEIKQADEIIIKALFDGMNKKIHYKDIYKLAKKRVETFVELKGKTPIPSIEFQYLESKGE